MYDHAPSSYGNMIGMAIPHKSIFDRINYATHRRALVAPLVHTTTQYL